MIFYLSCTGNTRWAARRVADAIGDKLVDMASEMKRAPKGELEYALAKGERVGFFFPVHGWRPPKLVRDFISRLRVASAVTHYCYAVCTAGDNIGETITIFERDLASSTGLRVHSAISLIMPESYIALPLMYLDKPDSERRKKAEADRKLTHFIDDIKTNTIGIRDITIGHWPRINSRFIGHLFVKHLVKDDHFRVEADKCIGCGKCETLCPVADIKLDTDTRHPIWLHNGRCLTCFSCYHHCPTNAIEFGKRTKGKGQYYYEKAKS